MSEYMLILIILVIIEIDLSLLKMIEHSILFPLINCRAVNLIHILRNQVNVIHATCLTIWSLSTTVLIFGLVSGEELMQLRATFSIEII